MDLSSRVYDLTAIDNGQVADLFDLFWPTFWAAVNVARSAKIRSNFGWLKSEVPGLQRAVPAHLQILPPQASQLPVRTDKYPPRLCSLAY